MASSTYANNKSKLRKIATAVQSAIEDDELSIAHTLLIINDFKTFNSSTRNDPRLVDPGSILQLSNLAAIKCFTNVYTYQVKAKNRLIRVTDIACGKHDEQTTAEFIHKNNKCIQGNCFFSRPHLPLPLEVTATSTVDHLVDPIVGNYIQRNSVHIPPSSTSTLILITLASTYLLRLHLQAWIPPTFLT